MPCPSGEEETYRGNRPIRQAEFRIPSESHHLVDKGWVKFIQPVASLYGPSDSLVERPGRAHPERRGPPRCPRRAGVLGRRVRHRALGFEEGVSVEVRGFETLTLWGD